jgi:hypothetical protein
LEESDDKEGGILAPKKVDLRYAISSLSTEIACGGKLQEEHKSD